ncbi:MAG: TonB-dependent receptor plug domain-containing protein, partial [Planctomycetota bacterium]
AVRGPQMLRPSAIDAARNIRFSPALLNGVPIPVQISYTFRFVAPGPMLPSATSTSAVADASNAPTADASDASGTPGSLDAPGSFDSPNASESSSSADASDAPDSLFRARGPDVVVLTRRYTRSATDFRIRLDLENLAASGGTSGAAALRAAPGVYISNHSGQGKGHQIFLRGFDAVHGQDVAVSAGGIPVNDVSNIHAQGYVDLHFLIPEVIKQMRVLEGPFDPAQGDFAVAGSIEFDLGLPKTGVWTRFSIGQFGLVRSLVAWRPEEA